MKRYGNLWPQIVSFENLWLAARRAERGKRYRQNVLEFNYHREQEILQLVKELIEKTYRPGAYRTFEIREPKRRLISAAPYRDRVVHHALCNFIVPIFERTFIADSYANRIGFGTHRALRRFTGFLRSNRYILQCDIRKYFPSIDHQILKDILRRKIKCRDTLWLIDTIIDASNPQEDASFYFPGDTLFTPTERRRGLPIGNLTSQFFANAYLNGFDHYVKETLKAAQYIRYVDDFALFSDDLSFLREAQEAIRQYLNQLRLQLHPVKSQIRATKVGANFLGFRVLPDRIRVRSENLRRARRRFKKIQQQYLRREIGLNKVNQSVQSWLAHLDHGDTWRLREKIFTSLVFKRETLAFTRE